MPTQDLDPLTWLPGRQAFEQRLAGAIRAARSNAKLAAIVIDLDRMHAVNALLGCELGDRVLHEAAARMARALGPGIPLARLQEDDFAAFAPVGDRPDAAKLAHGVLQACRAPYVIGCVSVTTTASIGIALWPLDGTDGTTLVGQAEDALHSAKVLGGNRFFPGEPTCCGDTARRPRRAPP